ncbi:VOC family protein [Gordonia hydrophobica]|uniref:Glyoxalase n=1 Tax=Gordonia hydrophobica TaxID=40516 RepID=A0ABZ2TVB3_9ACTN|nr:glyoxalase [Gordonia hydrophobica]MBM7366077.1 putative lactoylglutathione lyase [Gordonia hydrophobica]
MHKMIFVNLPVADLDASKAFFGAIGYRFDERFSDENAAALVLGETQVAMLLRRDFYQTFVPGREVIDATTTSGAILCLDADSREVVDEIVGKALAAGATFGNTEDHGFMYGSSFYDLDGHGWEIMWMDPAAVEAGPENYAAAQNGH